MAIPSSRSLIFEVKSTGSELAFDRLRQTSDVFGRLRTSLEDFGLLRESSEMIVSSSKIPALQDKNLTLISQKKLVGILSANTKMAGGRLYVAANNRWI